MAAIPAAKRALHFSSASSKSILSRATSTTTKTPSFASSTAKFNAFSSSNKPTSNKLYFSRTPVELGGVLTLVPLHHVTASALSTSLLSLHSNSWGFLSEGFATPL